MTPFAPVTALAGLALTSGPGAAPAADLQPYVLHDGTQLVVAGTDIVCGDKWIGNAAHLICFRQPGGKGSPPTGSYGFDLSRRYAAVVRYAGGKPHAVVAGRQPATVRPDERSQRGSARTTVRLGDDELARVAGAALVLEVSRNVKAGLGLIAGPLTSSGKFVVGSYIVALTANEIVLARIKDANGAVQRVFRRRL